MEKTLFIRNFGNANYNEVKAEFKRFGNCEIRCHVVYALLQDKYGFAEYDDPLNANNALKNFDKKIKDKNNIDIEWANDDDEKTEKMKSKKDSKSKSRRGRRKRVKKSRSRSRERSRSRSRSRSKSKVYRRHLRSRHSRHSSDSSSRSPSPITKKSKEETGRTKKKTSPKDVSFIPN